MTTSEQFRAFNEEIAALRRIGMPLSLGLPMADKALDSTLSRISTDVARRMSDGQTCLEAVASESSELPLPYRQIIEAGLRAGRLSTALESVLRHARRVFEMRQCLGHLMIYPIAVALLACVLLVVLSVTYVPHLEQTFATMRLSPTPASRWAMTVAAALPVWLMLPPLAIGAVMYMWWRSARNTTGFTRDITPPLSWLPGFRKLVRDARLASFAELLALLRANGVAMSEALQLASRSTGNTAGEVTSSTMAGDVSSVDEQQRGQLPPFLAWALGMSDEHGEQVEALRTTAALYSERARQRGEFLQTVLPLAMCVVLAGGAVFVYVASFWAPLCSLLIRLCEPITGPGVF